MSKKILIITPSWIGDCVMTQPLYRRLHELHPGCTIDAFAPKWSMAVFERMPEISRVIENPFGHGALELKKRWRIGRELGKQGYDQVIVLPGSLKSALIAFATGIKQRTGYVGESRYLLLNDIRKLDKAALPLMVDRYTALAHPTQADFNGHSDNPRFTISRKPRRRACEIWLKHGQTRSRLLSGCGIRPCQTLARAPFRRTRPPLSGGRLAGLALWFAKDFDIAEEINRLSDDLCTNLCGKTNLSEAIDLLSCADTVVCNDSGLMHLAAALDRKLVATYGSSSPDHTPPLSQKAKIVSLHLECSPCFKRECPLGHTDCLNKLTPGMVQKAAEELAQTQSK